MGERAWRGIWRGLVATAPLALGVAPFGLAYGAAAGPRMGLASTQLMSLTVFAGTAQFVAASMLVEGAAYVPVVITGLLINLRLILMSAAVTPYVSQAPRPLRPLVAQLLTDESFAVSMAEFERRGADVPFFIGSGLAIFSAWQVATLAGALFGAHLPGNLGLDFALPASLICLLFLLVRERGQMVVAAGAAVLALLLRPLIGGTWATMAATLIAATVGLGWACRREALWANRD